MADNDEGFPHVAMKMAPVAIDLPNSYHASWVGMLIVPFTKKVMRVPHTIYATQHAAGQR